MQDIKLIIFDLDGTLIDAYAAINSSFNFTMRQLGLKLQKAAKIRAAVGWGDINLLSPFVPRKKIKIAINIYRQHHRLSLIRRSKLYPQASLLLRRLKRKGYKLAVASNRPTKFSLILLKHLKIFNLFDEILCADKLKKGKPAPQILNRIISKLGFRKDQALYVGDMIIDAQAGRRARVKTVIVTTGSSQRSEIKKEKPFKIIPVIAKLEDLL